MIGPGYSEVGVFAFRNDGALGEIALPKQNGLSEFTQPVDRIEIRNYATVMDLSRYTS